MIQEIVFWYLITCAFSIIIFTIVDYGRLEAEADAEGVSVDLLVAVGLAFCWAIIPVVAFLAARRFFRRWTA